MGGSMRGLPLRGVLAPCVLVLVMCGVASAQDTVISGTVTTAADGLSLPGAEVSVSSLGISTTTDTAGKYSLSVPTGKAGRVVDVKVSFPGLVTQTLRVTLSAPSVTQDF